MPARHRPRAAGRRTQRRKLVWDTQDVALTVAAGALGNVNLVAMFEAAGASNLGTTIMRTHLSIYAPFATAADTVTLGLVVGRKSELGPGLGPNPSAAVDQAVDWMWLQRFHAPFSGATADAQREIVLDSRARRKLEEFDQEYHLQVSNGAAAQSVYSIFCRTLLALP